MIDIVGDERSEIPEENTELRWVYDDAWNEYIAPEIAKRKAQGSLEEDYTAPLVFYVQLFADRREPIVKLDAEVESRVGFRAEILDDAPDAAGRRVAAFRELEFFQVDLADRNAAHIAGIRLGSHYRVYADFRFNRENAERLVTLADQFCATARFSLGKSFLEATADLIFSTYELVLKARLWMERSNADFAPNTHRRVIHKRAERDHPKGALLHKELESLRARSRYGYEQERLDGETLRAILDVVSCELAELHERLELSHVERRPDNRTR